MSGVARRAASSGNGFWFSRMRYKVRISPFVIAGNCWLASAPRPGRRPFGAAATWFAVRATTNNAMSAIRCMRSPGDPREPDADVAVGTPGGGDANAWVDVGKR
eukprot:2010144-Pyramimonas_sp.AAC.1